MDTGPNTIVPGSPRTRADRRRRENPGNYWRKAVVQLRIRGEVMRWWIEAMQAHPLGFVSPATAARMLGCSRSRVFDLVNEGTIRTITGMPNSKPGERWVLVVDLVSVPGRWNCEKPGVYGKNKSTPKKPPKPLETQPKPAKPRRFT